MPTSYLSCLCAGVIAVLPLAVASNAMAQDSDRYSQGQAGYDDESYRRESPPPEDRGRDSYARSGDSYARSGSGRDDAYRPPADDYDRAPRDDGSYRTSRRDSFSNDRPGEAYSPPPRRGGYDDGGGYPDPQGPPPSRSQYYEEGEIVQAGHSFFGSVTKGLAGAVEYAFKSQGRPNGYILGEDASGAFLVGLRYGEGKLFTKDAGVHKVYWQGPSFGYDMGAEGSKTMVLVYNMHDPSEIYERFGGAEGSAYLVGGVSVQFQTYGHVTLGVIRSGLGLRLGANVGYSKYSRSPTWNPL